MSGLGGHSSQGISRQRSHSFSGNPQIVSGIRQAVNI
jgi:hypothetical protein